MQHSTPIAYATGSRPCESAECGIGLGGWRAIRVCDQETASSNLARPTVAPIVPLEVRHPRHKRVRCFS